MEPLLREPAGLPGTAEMAAAAESGSTTSSAARRRICPRDCSPAAHFLHRCTTSPGVRCRRLIKETVPPHSLHMLAGTGLLSNTVGGARISLLTTAPSPVNCVLDIAVTLPKGLA